MKTYRLHFIVLFVISLLFSCTKDGEDGKAYISITWEYQDSMNKVISFSDDNPFTPIAENIEEDQFYETLPGTYYFTYHVLVDGNIFENTGSYTIIINEGEPAESFSDGENGLDNYYELHLGLYNAKLSVQN